MRPYKNYGVAEMSNQSYAIMQRLWNCCSVRRDESLEDTDNLPDPNIIAVEIVEDLEAALEQFRLIAEDLGSHTLEK